jgi:two-component system, OmpR family, phosphate regulon sensor histidine kinase PhoR
MQNASLTAIAWRQSWILWIAIYISCSAIAYWFFDWQGVLGAWAVVSSLQVIRAYRKLGHILNQLESRAISANPDGLGLWSALETLIYKRSVEHRKRINRLATMLRGYRHAASAMPEGALVINRLNGYIVWSNKTAKRLLGLQSGKDDANLFQILPANVKTWFQEHHAEQPLLNVPAPIGTEIYLDFFLIPYTSERSLLVLRDSTKMRRLENMRSDFVANVSHELRTPLTVIHGYLELIDQVDNPELQNIILEMQKQSKRMNTLVEDLLNLSRLESESMLVDEAINLPALLSTLHQEAIALSQGRHQINIISHCQDNLLGAHQEIHSAFSNLVSNAVRYTPTGGQITIGVEKNKLGSIDFYVTDTGFGIPANHINRLTERFYRVSASRSRELGGTGLGLSICKHVLNLHQAELIIESTIGKGSTFRCRFPIQRVSQKTLKHLL